MSFSLLTTLLGKQQGIDEINARFDKAVGHEHDGTDFNGGQIDGANVINTPSGNTTSTTVQNAVNELQGDINSINTAIGNINSTTITNTPFGPITATTVQDAVNELVAKIPPPGNDYIINASDGSGYGGKITWVSGLNVNVSVLEAMIGRKYHYNPSASNFALSARMAAILYETKNASSSSLVATLGKANASFPASDSGTIYQWFTDGSATIISSPAGNNLTKNGTVTQVDGWIGYGGQGDGSTGYYVSASSTGFPIGATERRINLLVTPMKIGTLQRYIMYGTSSNNIIISMLANNNLGIYTNATENDTGYALEIGKTYYISVMYDSTKILCYINGVLIITVTVVLTTGVGNFNLMRNSSGTEFAQAIIHYVEIGNKIQTPAQIAAISNKLCLPVRYNSYLSSYPANDVTAGTHIYKFDDTSGTTITDENGTLNGTATGTSIVDSELGLGKVRKFNGSSDYVALGNYTMPTDFTFIFCGKLSSISNGTFLANYNGSAGFGFGHNNGLVRFFSNGNQVSTTSVGIGIVNFIALVCKGGTSFTYYVNSPYPDPTVTGSLGTNSSLPLFVGKTGAGIEFLNGTAEYLVMFSRTLSQQDITVYYNALMKAGERTIVDDLLPANSISLGFARTNSTQLTEVDDSSYKYMRNEGATKSEGNKRVFLGWRYTGVSTTTKFTNLLNTENCRVSEVWYKLNLTDYQHSIIPQGTTVGCSVPVVNSNFISITTTATNIIAAANSYTGAAQASGYIGVWIELL